MITTTYKKPTLSKSEKEKLQELENEELKLHENYKPYQPEARQKRKKCAQLGLENPFIGVDNLPRFEDVASVMSSCEAGRRAYKREKQLIRINNKDFLMGLLNRALEDVQATLDEAQKQVDEINAKLPAGVTKVAFERSFNLQVRINELKGKIESFSEYENIRGILRGVFADEQNEKNS
jgi:hypothetical protein